MPAGFLNHQNVVSQVMAPVSSTSLSNKNPTKPFTNSKELQVGQTFDGRLV